MMINNNIVHLAKMLWDYQHMNHTIQKSDCILVLGNHDLRVAEYAADLFLKGYAPFLIISGGFGNYTKGVWETAEADLFASIAVDKGVPAEKIIIENKSTNTGENITFTKKLLHEKGIEFNSFILVQKPYMERRSYATFKMHWPDKNVLVTSPPIPFEKYTANLNNLELEINILVGDIQRIKEYPAKGFQIPQAIPENVWDAYLQLVKLGFNKHLIT
ncbi:MAG: YdcF family protein [Ginsengibacter sp.]